MLLKYSPPPFLGGIFVIYILACWTMDSMNRFVQGETVCFILLALMVLSTAQEKLNIGLLKQWLILIEYSLCHPMYVSGKFLYCWN